MTGNAELFGVSPPIDEATGLGIAILLLQGAGDPQYDVGSDAYEGLLQEVMKRTDNVLHLSEEEALSVIKLAITFDVNAWAWAFKAMVYFIEKQEPMPKGLRMFAGVAHSGATPPGKQGRKKTKNEYRNRLLVRTVSILDKLGLIKTQACAVAGQALGKLGYGEITGDAVSKVVNSYRPPIDDDTYFFNCLVKMMMPRKK